MKGGNEAGKRWKFSCEPATNDEVGDCLWWKQPSTTTGHKNRSGMEMQTKSGLRHGGE